MSIAIQLLFPIILAAFFHTEYIGQLVINYCFSERVVVVNTDLNLFLDVPIGFVEQSLAKHREGTDRNYLEGARDIHEADIRFQQAVRDLYRAEAARDPHFLRIDCAGPDGEMLPPDDIFTKVRAAVDPYLP